MQINGETIRVVEVEVLKSHLLIIISVLLVRQPWDGTLQLSKRQHFAQSNVL